MRAAIEDNLWFWTVDEDNLDLNTVSEDHTEFWRADEDSLELRKTGEDK